MSVCKLCFGKGYVIGEGYAPCGHCGGSGFVDDDEYENADEESEEMTNEQD